MFISKWAWRNSAYCVLTHMPSCRFEHGEMVIAISSYVSGEPGAEIHKSRWVRARFVRKFDLKALPHPLFVAFSAKNTGRSLALQLCSNGDENKTGFNFKKLLRCALSLLWEKYLHPVWHHRGLITTAACLSAPLTKKKIIFGIFRTFKSLLLSQLNLMSDESKFQTSTTFPPFQRYKNTNATF